MLATRDRPQLLRQAIQSVLEQDYDADIQVLAVFDQAEPEADLAREDPGRTVTVLSNARTAGLPGARNTGILAAQSPLIAFCDDDDRWLPSKLRLQVAAMQRLCLAAAVTGICVHYGTKRRQRLVTTERITLADLVRDRITAAHPSSYLVDMKLVLEQAGLVDEELPGGYGEDYDWLLRVARFTDVAVVPEPLVDVLWHPGSFFTRQWGTIIDALDYLVDKHPELSYDRRGLARIEGQQAFALAALGRRRESLVKVTASLRHSPSERRAFATIPVLCGLLRAETVLHMANSFGRGI